MIDKVINWCEFKLIGIIFIESKLDIWEIYGSTNCAWTNEHIEVSWSHVRQVRIPSSCLKCVTHIIDVILLNKMIQNISYLDELISHINVSISFDISKVYIMFKETNLIQ
jgi:hypothetical protein